MSQTPAAWLLPPRHARLPVACKPSGQFRTQRVGPAGDGGYTVATDVLHSVGSIVSLGLGDDWRFEQHLQELTGAPLLVLDGTVDESFWALRSLQLQLRRLRPGAAHRRSTINDESGYLRYRRFFAEPSREHRRENVGYPAPGWVTLASALAGMPQAGIFFKCDIEGWEWRILDDIVAERYRFVALVMEFHDVDLLLPRLVDFLNRMDDFTVIDAAANNFGSVCPDGTPEVVEIALARTDLLRTPAAGCVTVAAEPNSRLASPIELAFG